MVEIKGDTYPVKDALKALGARWNPDKKCWMITDEKADEARRIVASATGAYAPRVAANSTRKGCACTMGSGCCSPRCKCGCECNCRGGPIWDC